MKRSSWLYRITTSPMKLNWPEPADKCAFIRQFTFGFALNYSVLTLITLAMTFSVMVSVGMVYEFMMVDFSSAAEAVMYIEDSWRNSVSSMMHYYAETLIPDNNDSWHALAWSILAMISLFLGVVLMFFVAVVLMLSVVFIVILLIVTLTRPLLKKAIENKPTQESFGKVGEVHGKFCSYIEYEN